MLKSALNFAVGFFDLLMEEKYLQSATQANEGGRGILLSHQTNHLLLFFVVQQYARNLKACPD